MPAGRWRRGSFPFLFSRGVPVRWFVLSASLVHRDRSDVAGVDHFAGTGRRRSHGRGDIDRPGDLDGGPGHDRDAIIVESSEGNDEVHHLAWRRTRPIGSASSSTCSSPAW